jgi:hypothetical protein
VEGVHDVPGEYAVAADRAYPPRPVDGEDGEREVQAQLLVQELREEAEVRARGAHPDAGDAE